MPNHLTPEELSKELGIDRHEVIRVCMQEAIPIYQGRIELADEARDHLAGEVELGFLDLDLLDGVLDLLLRANILGEEERLERERVALRADEAEVLGALANELADRRHPGLLHRIEEQH